MDKMILTMRFTEFVNEVVKIKNEETKEQTEWEFWLHKVFNMTYQEFIGTVNRTNGVEESVASDEELATIVVESKGIINGFCPS